MITINENYLKLKAGYLFPEISRRVAAFTHDHPHADVIRLGIGDVTLPLAPAVIEAFHQGVEDLAHPDRFKGYGPEQGYEFLARAIIENDYQPRGVDLAVDEIFISDGSKCDTGNIQEIFGLDNRVAVADPVYPVYVDTNVMAGRTGPADDQGRYQGLLYLPCTPENNFTPQPPDQPADLIYLCSPNNPTGAVLDKPTLTCWIDYARTHHAVILFDAAYEAYISDPTVPHSIYEIPHAPEVAIEFRSFSKSAGFTGARCAFTVVPKALRAYTAAGAPVPVNPLWNRRHCTKFNGVSYPVQRAAAAACSPTGQQQIRRQIEYYLNNARLIRSHLRQLGYAVYGGVNAPYIWLQTPNRLSSWDFFDKLLHEAHVVGTPGRGFGAAGEGFFRLSAFAPLENVQTALHRFSQLQL